MRRGVRCLVAAVGLQCIVLIAAVPVQLRAGAWCDADCPSGTTAQCACGGTDCQCQANENHCWAVCASGGGCEDTRECEGPLPFE